jgi:hypothetical protein
MKKWWGGAGGVAGVQELQELQNKNRKVPQSADSESAMFSEGL